MRTSYFVSVSAEILEQIIVNNLDKELPKKSVFYQILVLCIWPLGKPDLCIDWLLSIKYEYPHT